MSEHDDRSTANEAAAGLPAKSVSKPLSMKGSFGTAVGATMLGFEQALRDLPPPETMAAEHAPERGLTGDGLHLVIHFPEPMGGSPDPLDDSPVLLDDAEAADREA